MHHGSDPAGHFSLALKLQLRFPVTTLDGRAYRIKFRKFLTAVAVELFIELE